ncbi:MAG TPA: type III-A CRISPR-associated protein Csm2 [Anaerolineales bacterium]|nr:type III-A CRISPR-associated protein Csm2 [Anaerolineales bacterium]
MQNSPRIEYKFPAPPPDVLKQIITNDRATAVLVETAMKMGEALSRPLSTSQIRFIYGVVQQIKADWLVSRDERKKAKARRTLLLLRPKMAYRARKEGGAVKNLVEVLDPAVVLVGDDEDNFRRFYEFFEAILAYHKAAGGK